MRCPCCGANLTYKDSMYVCEYCGHEQKEKVEIAKNNYNLVITHLNGTSSVVTIRIVDARINFDLKVNSTVSFKLAPGPHTIEFQEGVRKNSRVVNVPGNGEAVKVDYSYDSLRKEPVIIRVTEPGADPTYTDTSKSSLLPPQRTGLTVAAFIMGICGLSIPAIIMGSISASRARKSGRKEHKMDTWAQLLGYLWIMFHLAIFAAMVRN